MKAVRQAGTKPEVLVRRAMSARNIRYRLNVRSLPGSPDIANVRQHFAIFVHGCFWHRHEGCRFATTPKTNVDFWSKKFADNIARDRAKIRALESRSFRVLVVWECQTRDDTLEVTLNRFFDADRLAPISISK
ncbi:very short patch repair endonuclease [Archangium sp.]|uniref:very short patch repair endonuclease n=1 Tax=Archangium sp. TaxID=1872627 RepID=UPI00389B1112